MELEIIRLIQGFSSPLLDRVFEMFTVFGEGITIITILTSIYWAVDKKLGEYIGFSFFTSMLVNNFIKDIFKAKRPIGEAGIRSLRTETATGYSFPSGHSQGSATFYSAIAISMKKRWLYILFSIIVFLVGLSRLYLGVHYPKDVIVGILLGVLTSCVCYYLFNRFKNRIMLYIVIFILFLPVLLMNNSPDFIKALGGYFGFLVGIYFEKHFVGFSVDGSGTKRGIRVILGIVLIGLVQLGLKMIMPENSISYFIRYAVMCFIGIGLYPYIFKKIKL